MFLEPEIVTQIQQEELPVEVPETNTNLPDDSTDIKTEIADVETAKTTIVEVTEVSETTDAVEKTLEESTVGDASPETITDVVELTKDNEEIASNELQETPVESNIQATDDQAIVENENILSQDVSEKQNVETSKTPDIVTSSVASPKPKKNQIAPMALPDVNTNAASLGITEIISDSENIENIPITSPKPKKNQIQPMEILEPNNDRPTSAKSLRNFTNQELFSIGSRANTNISETAIDNWTKVNFKIKRFWQKLLISGTNNLVCTINSVPTT